MGCPFLQKVVMLQCRACPVRKLVPMNESTAHGACFEDNFHDCRLFLEAAGRLPESPEQQPASGPEGAPDRKGERR